MPISSRNRFAVRIALAVCLAGLAVHIAHTGFGVGRPGLDNAIDNWLYNALMGGASVLILLRAALVKTDRAAWLLLGAGVLSWSAGDWYFSLVLANDPNPPVPSISDGLYLAFYPAACASLALLVRRNLRELHRGLWIDALMAALAVSSVAVALLYDAVSVGITGDVLTIGTTVAYPIGDLSLLVIVAGVAALTGWRPGGTWTVIALALFVVAAGDGVFLWQSAHGTYTDGTLLDSAWPAAALLLAVAAWAPRRLAEAKLDGVRMLALPSIFAGMAMLVLIADQFDRLDPVAVGLALATLVTLIARLADTLQVNLRMVADSRGEARTDELTGLGNRRRLFADLERTVRASTGDDPHVLMLFDVDGFKRYNDTHGHLAGDALLARVGARLAAAVEPHGRAYRMGGDEFCALLRGDAATLEQAVHTAAEALNDDHGGATVRASYGAVTLPHEADNVASALHLADQRMYAHKQARDVRRQEVPAPEKDVTVMDDARYDNETAEHVVGVLRSAA